MKKSDFVYDAAKNTATISVDFAKKSSNVHSVEYRFLINERQKNPTMTIVIRTHDSGNRLTYKDMENRLRRIDKNGKLVEAFNLVKEIAKTESCPYTYVYNWYKAQMDIVKAEKESEKKAVASNKEDMQKKLAELMKGVSYDASAAEEEPEKAEDFEKAED